MKFEPGNRLAKGGKREGAGRPPKVADQIEKAAAEIARDYIERSVKPVMATYFQLAHGRYVNKYHEGKIIGQEFEADAGTTRHFVDKLLPDEQIEAQRPIQINFVQYHNSLQLHAQGVPVTVLASDGERHQAGGNGMASPVREGQDIVKFLNFKDVP